MLERLRIRNFKAWKDTGQITLAPITVFFGVNSSGKTSIHQMLLMLKQTAQSPDRQRVLHPGDRNTMIDLGTVQDMVFGHEDDAKISFEFEWSLREPLQITDAETDQRFEGDKIAFAAEVGQQQQEPRNIFVKRMRYTLGDSAKGGLIVGMDRQPGQEPKYELKFEGYRFVRNPGRPWPLPSPIKFYGFPDEVRAHFQNADVVSELTLALERMLGELYYVGPIRDYPDRSYTWSGERPDHVGQYGERVVEALLAARERTIRPLLYARGEKFQKVVARWLKEIGLISEFEAEPIAPRRKDYEVLVTTPHSKYKVNLTDVGFGISQFLPVLVECFYLPSGASVILEQPELHLHPSAQSGLADLFIEAIHAREEGQDRRIQFLIESHSEHFLRRLQRRIAEQKLKPEEVAIYSCSPGPEGSRIERIEVDPFGNITNWPKGFFGDEIGDLAAMTDAAMKRQIELGK